MTQKGRSLKRDSSRTDSAQARLPCGSNVPPQSGRPPAQRATRIGRGLATADAQSRTWRDLGKEAARVWEVRIGSPLGGSRAFEVGRFAVMLTPD